MATTKIKQLESFDSGSNYSFGDKMERASTPRSVFNLSHVITGSWVEIGTIMPVEIIPTIPGDHFEIEINTLLRALPSVVPLESKQRLYLYAFYSRMGDLWNKFETFMTKGYSGNEISRRIPCITHGKNCNENNMHNAVETDKNSEWDDSDVILPTSMGECLGLPLQYEQQTHTIDGVSITNFENVSYFKRFTDATSANKNREKISALPFMMLLRIWRDYFTNKDYWINDRIVLPDDDTDFRLDDNGELLSAKAQGMHVWFDIASKHRGISSGVTGLTVGLPIHEYPKDRWTSALPFMQRGSAPDLTYELNTNTIPLNIFSSTGAVKTAYGRISEISDLGGAQAAIPVGMKGTGTSISTDSNGINWLKADESYFETTDLSTGDYAGIKIDGTNFGISIKMADIRKLAIEQTELEKMARTDGSYAEFGLTFFGIVSKNAVDHKPVYIGGSYKEITYTEVVQTSESGSTPMGSYVGHSTTGDNSYIGSIDCDDYGYIMILGCIMPDVIYSQGLDDHWTNLAQAEMYLPERSKLGMTALLNKTLFFDYENDETKWNTNNYLWGYQNIFDEYRYLPNKIKGEIANAHNLEMFPYTQSRLMVTTPTWSREFAEASPNNVRNDYLTAPKALPPFTYEMGLKIRAVRPIPYKSIPANLTGL